MNRQQFRRDIFDSAGFTGSAGRAKRRNGEGDTSKNTEKAIELPSHPWSIGWPSRLGESVSIGSNSLAYVYHISKIKDIGASRSRVGNLLVGNSM